MVDNIRANENHRINPTDVKRKHTDERLQYDTSKYCNRMMTRNTTNYVVTIVSNVTTS